MKPLRKVVRKDRSPMNPRVWVMQLECGHDKFCGPPLKKSYECDRCPPIPLPTSLLATVKIPPPTPHARKRPNLTISMLEALKRAYDEPAGMLRTDRGVMKALVKRGLADFTPNKEAIGITENGQLLIETQYEALKQVLPETRSQYL